MSLAHEQAQFARWVTQRVADEARASASLVEGAVSVARGLAAYQNNLRQAWRNALAATFPVMVQLIGEDGFTLSVRDYCEDYPAQSGDLNEFGQHFSQFIASYEPLAEYSYLSDVARLEWLLHGAHYAANHMPLRIEDLMVHGTEDWLSAQVRFAPSACLYEASHAAVSIWQAHQTQADLASLQAHQCEFAIVSRPVWRVDVMMVDEAAFVFLQALYSGATFEEAFTVVDDAKLSLDVVALLPVLIEAGIWCDIIWANQ
jgi:hypothetical protein